MAVGLLGGIEAGIRGFQANDQMQRRNQLANRQQDVVEEANLRERYTQNQKELKDRYKIVMSNIAQASGNVTAGQDFTKLFDDPNAVKDVTALLATRPDYQTFTDENGQVQKTALHRIVPSPTVEGHFNIELRRMDNGQIVPLTDGATSNGDPLVTQISKEDLNSHLKSRWQAGITYGGLEDNAGIFQTGSSSVEEAKEQNQIALISEALLDAGSQQIEDPTALRMFGDLINKTQDIPTLRKIAAKLNLGPQIDEIVAEGQKQTEENWYQANPEEDPTKEGSIAKLLADRGVTREKWEAADDKEREAILETLQIVKATSDLVRQVGGGSVAAVKDLIKGSWNGVLNTVNAIKDSPRVRAMASFLGDDDALTRADSEELSVTPYQDKNEAAIKAADPDGIYKKQPIVSATTGSQIGTQLVRTNERSTGKNPTGEEVSSALGSIEPPSFELTADNIRTAIMAGTEKPTAEQIEAVRTFIGKEEVENPQQLQEIVASGVISAKEARNVAWIMAGSMGAGKDAAALAQNLINYIERGDQELSSQQQQEMTTASNTARAQVMKARLEQQKFLAQQRETLDGKVLASVEAASGDADKYTKIFDEIFGIRVSGDDPEGGGFTSGELTFSKETLTQFTRAAAGFRAKMKRGSITPQAARVYADAFNPYLSLYAQARTGMVDLKGVDAFSAGWWGSLFNKDAPQSVSDFDLAQLRVAEFDKNGKPVSVAYVDEKGQRGRAVPIADIQGDDRTLASMIAFQAEANSLAAEDK